MIILNKKLFRVEKRGLMMCKIQTHLLKHLSKLELLIILPQLSLGQLNPSLLSSFSGGQDKDLENIPSRPHGKGKGQVEGKESDYDMNLMNVQIG